MESKKNIILHKYEVLQTIEGIPCHLGFGSYGSVHLGRCLKTKQTVAIKKIGKKMALNEVEIHLKLNHPNIIKMLDYSFDEKKEITYIILEYAENGTLFDYIR
jgi:serine/threonine protein kinase